MFGKSSKIYSIFRLKCPRCHEGNLFKRRNPYIFKEIGDMPQNCSSCGQPFSLEPGFYFGAAYVSYGMNVAWLIGLFLVAVFVWGMPYGYFLLMAAGVLVILTPVLFRLSRAIWIHLFVKYDPNAIKQT